MAISVLVHLTNEDAVLGEMEALPAAGCEFHHGRQSAPPGWEGSALPAAQRQHGDLGDPPDLLHRSDARRGGGKAGHLRPGIAVRERLPPPAGAGGRRRTAHGAVHPAQSGAGRIRGGRSAHRYGSARPAAERHAGSGAPGCDAPGHRRVRNPAHDPGIFTSPDPHGHRQGRGRRPGTGAGTRRGRLHHQTVQPAGTLQPDPRRPAPERDAPHRRPTSRSRWTTG